MSRNEAVRQEEPFAVHEGILDDGTPYRVEDWDGILPGPGETLWEWFSRLAKKQSDGEK